MQKITPRGLYRKFRRENYLQGCQTPYKEIDGKFLLVHPFWPPPIVPPFAEPKYRRFTDSPQSTPTCWFFILFMTICTEFYSTCIIYFYSKLNSKLYTRSSLIFRLYPLWPFKILTLRIIYIFFILQYICKIGHNIMYVQLNYILL